MENETLAQGQLKEHLMQDPDFRRLAELQAKGWQNLAGDDFFEQRRQQVTNADSRGQIILFEMMGSIAKEMNDHTGAFNISTTTTPTVLDFCAAPGGFVKYALQINPSAKVDALSLSEQQGGHIVRIPYGHWDPRYFQ